MFLQLRLQRRSLWFLDHLRDLKLASPQLCERKHEKELDSYANILESSPGSSEKFTTPRIEEDDPFKSTIAAPDKDATKPLSFPS
jgi:hypothetical protein